MLFRGNAKKKKYKKKKSTAAIMTIFAIILVWGYYIAGAGSIQGMNNIIKNIMP